MHDDPRAAVVADDLTGAADTGAAFARHGLRTLVCLSLSTVEAIPQADVLVISTESRGLAPGRAIEAIAAAAGGVNRWLAGRPVPLVYKKIDSTLRGHPADELVALMRALRIDRALMAPAFPAQGRTTVGGCQQVAGVPTAKTSFGREGAGSDLVAMMSPWSAEYPWRLIRLNDVRQGAAHVASLMPAGPGIWIGDAGTDDDLRVLAEAAARSGIRLLCGSAGLARVLPVDSIHAAQDAARSTPPVLAVVGSQHDATLRQVAAAGRAGATVVRLASRPAEDHGPVGPSGAVDQVVRELSGGRPVILAAPAPGGSTTLTTAAAHRLAAVVAGLPPSTPIGTLVLTGGDTAAAVCAALGTAMLWLDGELQPGMATGRLIGGLRPGLRVVTKAGGFGGDEALAAAMGVTRSG